jgi:hypothetical protein
MAQLCTWTWSPGAMALLAKPITWSYFTTGWPSAMARVATLWPRGICAVAVTPSAASAVPSRISARLTTTLSLGLSRMVRLAAGAWSGIFLGSLPAAGEGRLSVLCRH